MVEQTAPNEKTPVRIQRKRTKGWRMPEGAVYVGRPSRWGNPFAVKQAAAWPGPAGTGPWYVESTDGRRWHPEHDSQAAARQMAVNLFSLHTGPMGNYEYDDEAQSALRTELAGKDLACWCPLDAPCHADVLLQLANS